MSSREVLHVGVGLEDIANGVVFSIVENEIRTIINYLYFLRIHQVESLPREIGGEHQPGLRRMPRGIDSVTQYGVIHHDALVSLSTGGEHSTTMVAAYMK